MLGLLSALALLSQSVSVFGAPTIAPETLFRNSTRTPLGKRDALGKRAGPSAPYFVIYNDYETDGGEPAATSDITGFNVWIQGFWLTSGPDGPLTAWTNLAADTRESIVDEYHDAGIYFMVSAFGSTEGPTTAGVSATAAAADLAAFVKEYAFDGVDVDYEDTTAMNGGTAVSWIVEFQEALYSALGADYIYSHAPMAPWFTSVTSTYPDGDYLAVNEQVGEYIDFYNVQFYNQGDYDDCTTLITTADSVAYADTALLQIISSGVSADKLVLGKPITTADESSDGYMAAATEAECVATAVAAGWNGGLMFWEYRGVSIADLIDEVWGSTTTGTGINYEGQTCNGAGYTASAAPSYDDCEYLWDEIYGYGDTFTVDPDSAFGYTYGTCAIQFCNWGSEAIIYDYNEFASVASGIINFIADDGDDLAQCVFEEGDGAQYIQIQSSTATPDGANYSLSGRTYC